MAACVKVVLTGTRPCHVHCNGMYFYPKARKWFRSLVDHLDNLAPVKPSGAMRVVSFSSRKAAPLAAVTATKMGYPAVVLRPKVRWRNRLKVFLAIEYLESQSGNDIYMFSDGYDAVLTRPIGDTLDQFQFLQQPVIISAEKNPYPRDKRLNVQEIASRQHDTPFVYGNSGGVIGYRKSLLELYKKAVTFFRRKKKSDRFYNPFIDDQGAMRQAALALGVKRDEQCRIFYTLSMFEPGDAVLNSK
jgi:hypothetical protein